MSPPFLYAVTALGEIAWALAQVDSLVAGRGFAAYGGVYITASLGWLWVIESVRPDAWDALGVGLCLLGAASSSSRRMRARDRGHPPTP